MAGSSNEWSSNANDAVRISLVQPNPNGSKALSTFHPKFTYPIFGEEERIFGYQNLDLHFRFSAHDLRPNLEISYDKKFPAVGETAALDLNKALRDWIPKSAFQRRSDYEKAIRGDTPKDFKPPGSLVHSYSRKGRSFEIWAGSLSDPAIKEILDRIQIFISFFIEGGVPINTDDVEWTLERWTVYYVYEKLTGLSDASLSPYALVGYSTTYRFYPLIPKIKFSTKTDGSVTSLATFPSQEPISISSLPSRLRISQFLILPPHQRLGHGSELYNTIFNLSLSDPTIHELTVEDPNEEFDLIRDMNDYSRLLPHFKNSTPAIEINPTPFPPTQKRAPRRVPTSSLLPLPTLSALRKSFKIAPRQFSRLVELYLLSKIPRKTRSMGGANMTKILMQKHRLQNPEDRTYYFWRLLLKQRVYKKNRDTLIQMDMEERWQKLEETAMLQEGEYELILAAIEDRANKLGQFGGAATAGGSKAGGRDADDEDLAGAGGSLARKRKLVVDDDDDEDVDGGADDAKKVKTI